MPFPNIMGKLLLFVSLSFVNFGHVGGLEWQNLDDNNILNRRVDANVLVVVLTYISWFTEHVIAKWLEKFVMVDMYGIWFEYWWF